MRVEGFKVIISAKIERPAPINPSGLRWPETERGQRLLSGASCEPLGMHITRKPNLSHNGMSERRGCTHHLSQTCKEGTRARAWCPRR